MAVATVAAAKTDIANKPLKQIKKNKTKKKKLGWKMTMTMTEKVKYTHGRVYAEGHFCGTDYKVESAKLLGRKICLVHQRRNGEANEKRKKKLIVHEIFAFRLTQGKSRPTDLRTMRVIHGMNRKCECFVHRWWHSVDGRRPFFFCIVNNNNQPVIVIVEIMERQRGNTIRSVDRKKYTLTN